MFQQQSVCELVSLSLAQLSLCQHGPEEAWQGDPKAAVKKKAAAKKAMAKKVAAKSLPKRPNKPAVTAVKLKPGVAQETEEASGSGLGLDRGLVSSLLTSFKYQVGAKKTSPQQKQDAQATLEKCMTGDLETKREIPKACSWVHNLTTSTESTEGSSETMSNRLTQRPPERYCLLNQFCWFSFCDVPTVIRRPGRQSEEILRVSRKKFKSRDQREVPPAQQVSLQVDHGQCLYDRPADQDED